MKLDLTDTERLILANQYDIMAKLTSHSGEHYADMAATLRSGHKWLYDQFFQDLSPNMPAHQAQLVLDILAIYGRMRDSFNSMHDKTGIESGRMRFPGFDGNNEVEELAFCRDLLKHERYIGTLSQGDLNAHVPMVERYRAMIAAWKRLGEPQFPYSKEDILQILEAC